MSPVTGFCDPAFAAVRDAFERNFAAGRELGAAVAVYVGDRKVVDLWGGSADRRTGRAWEESTPCFAFSCTKAVTATAALHLAERGGLDLDGPVTAWWPEYGQGGKDGTTAAHLLSHQDGLPAFARPVSAEEAADADTASAILAAQEPEWTPGTAHGYHPLTFGWLAGEIVRRVAGLPVGAYARREFAGALDLWVGAPDDVIGRAARLAPGGKENAGPVVPTDDPEILAKLRAAMTDPASTFVRALSAPTPGKGGFNNPVVLRAGWPSAGMIATARSLAAFYRDLAAGRILKPDTLAEALRPRVHGPDRTLVVDSAFGLGYMRPATMLPVPAAGRATAFGHPGAGGSLGLGDPAAGLAFAYLPNRMGAQLAGDPRAVALLDAAYSALA
ncbi:serine hydrolase domain-containing protein [Actinomadura rayongensis]|uniref:Serine hydrolase n=1 Tax=Actinomadura rayongensis TaxID=1429076 RepID=A0A6I4W5T0_9ACTN|nr:serine hydrolase domain-containing protein [Actinomadura rayongensis]MXQ63576.1 serine hydrolase [Actinomadura rayongensis]